MSSIVKTAQDFFERVKDMTRDDVIEAVKELPKPVQNAYWKLRKDAYFVPENAITEKRWEVLSPTGKYKLVVTPFMTGPGGWNYTQGVVYRKDDDKPIATVQRNYGAFPKLFIEGHPKGDFLVCGEDYQGQTVVELNTGQRRDLMSEGSNVGGGFCWAAYRFDAPTSILVVDGCHWACPYLFRFYDFSDPMNGWPEIVAEKHIESDGKREPELSADGTIRCYQTRYKEDDDETTDEEESAKLHAPIVDVVQTFRREGLVLKLVEEWVSDYEKGKRAKREEYQRKEEAWQKNFRATDPLYLTYAELVKNTALSPADYMSIGQTHDGWCPDFKGRERRWCRRIITHKGKTGPTVDLEWAVDTGPIKICVYRDGKHLEDKFFPHSVEGMNAAFADALGHVEEVRVT